MSTVTGRVRPTVRLRQDEVDAPCVLATSWSSERQFPRTVGVGVPFEIETSAGEVFRVDPFDAVVALPVRRHDRTAGVLREYAWVAPDDEVTIEGDIDRDGPSRLPPALHATRIAVVTTATGGRHHIPPRALRAGEADEDHEPGAGVDAQQVPRRKKKKGSGTPPPVV
jgi:hypothetical protein